MKKMTLVITIILSSLAIGGVVYKLCGTAEKCLARDHKWYFKEVTFRARKNSSPGTETAFYVWRCDECGVTLSKCPAELTRKEKTAIMNLNDEGKMRVFRLKSDITWRERVNIGG